MSNGVALYYPHLEVQNHDWLKCALLFWDGGIRQIRPERFRSNDPVMQQLQAEGLLENALTDADIATAGNRFADIVLRLIEKLEPRDVQYLKEFRSDIPEGADKTFDNWMLKEKMPGLVRYRLAQMKLAHEVDGMIFMDRSMIAVYMTLLARAISARCELPLITDSEDYARIDRSAIYGELLRPSKDEVKDGEIVLKLDIGFPDPKDLANIPLAKLLQFRNRHADSLLTFRETIEKETEKVQAASPGAKADALEAASKHIRRVIDDHDALFGDLGVASLRSGIMLSMPPVLGAAPLLSAVGVATVAAPVAVGAFLVGGIAWGYEVRRNFRKLERDSPYQYLIELERLTKGRKPNVLQRIVRGLGARSRRRKGIGPNRTQPGLG